MSQPESEAADELVCFVAGLSQFDLALAVYLLTYASGHDAHHELAKLITHLHRLHNPVGRHG